MSAMSRSPSVMPGQGPELRKPILSPEAQRDYNHMRDVEEEWKRRGSIREALRQRERGRQDGTGHSLYLEIPMHHRRPRSRAGSVSSTAPSSTQGSDGGGEDNGRRKRGHRTHALDEPQRLRTAFMRKYVKACEECRQRRVKCIHFDSTELEANYQASKRAGLSVPPGPASLQIPMSPSVSYSPVQDPNELRGVGSHTIGCHNQLIPQHHEHFPDDIVLDIDSPTVVNNTRRDLLLSAQAVPIRINQASSPSYSSPYATPLDFDLLHTPFPSSYPVSPMVSSPSSSVGDVEKPLGFLANDATWHCQQGASDPYNFDPTYSDLRKCNARFQSHFSLLNHYGTHHEPFSNERIVRRCGCCGSFPGPHAQSCMKCRQDACDTCDGSWPLVLWYYGTMMPSAPSLVSGTSTIPTGQGFGNGFLDPSSSFFGSNSHGTSPTFPNFFGGGGGSSYAGSMSGQTFAASPSHPDVSSHHQATPKPALDHSHHDERSTSTETTKDDYPISKPLDSHHHHHHLPRMSSSSFSKCTSSSPTTFSLIVNSAKSLNTLNLPCLALAHYLILLLLLFFPLGSSDTDNSVGLPSSFVLDAARAMGYYHMPLVSVLCIIVGVIGMWLLRSGGRDVVVDSFADEVADEDVRERRDILAIPLVA